MGTLDLVCDLEAPSCGALSSAHATACLPGPQRQRELQVCIPGNRREVFGAPFFPVSTPRLLCSCSIREVGASLPLDTKPLRPAEQGCPGARLWTGSHIEICATGIPRRCRVMGSNLCSLVLWSLYSFSFAVLRGTGDSSNNFQVARGFKNTSAMQLERYLARSILNKC